MPACLQHKRAPLGVWSSDGVRSLFLMTWYLVWLLVPSVMVWVHLPSTFLHLFVGLNIGSLQLVDRFINQETVKISPSENEIHTSWLLNYFANKSAFPCAFVLQRCSLSVFILDNHQLNTAESVYPSQALLHVLKFSPYMSYIISARCLWDICAACGSQKLTSRAGTMPLALFFGSGSQHLYVKVFTT